MKLLFLTKQAFPLMGVMSISAFVKARGHQTDLWLISEVKNWLAKIDQSAPDVVAFSCFTGEHQWVLKQAQLIKKKYPKILILLGGPHPTYYPEIIKKPAVDVIVRGEAEEAVAELLDALAGKKEIKNIANLWLKRGKRIYKNSLRPLIEDLDKLPLADRTIYYQYPFLAASSVKQFLAGRGCPYQCSFCSNHLLRKMYQGKGRFVRRRSPQNVVKEIKAVKKKYGLKTISFTDDVFIGDKKWLQKFLPLYQKEVKAPFMVNVTGNALDEVVVRMLKKAGCYGLAMGVESGDEERRIKILRKNVTDDQLRQAGRLAKKYRLALKTFSILSLPGEKLEDAFKTIKINADLQPQSATASLLQPYPGYQITQYAIKKGFLAKDFGVDDVVESIYLSSPIKGAESREIENLQAFFPFLVAHPKFISVIKPWLKLSCRPLFRLVARFTYGYYMSRVHKLSWRDKLFYLGHMDPLKV